MGVRIEELFWELSAKTEKLRAAATDVEQQERRIKEAMAGAQDSTTAAGAATDRLAGQQEKAAQAMGGSHSATNKLRGGLVALAAQSTNTSGAVGQVVSALLLMGAGSLAVIGVAAGIALVTSVYHALTKEAREAEERLKAVREELEKARAEKGGPIVEAFTAGGVLADRKAQLQQEIQKLEDDRRKAAEIGQPLLPGDEQKIADKKAELVQLEVQLSQVSRQVADARAERTGTEIERLALLIANHQATNAERERAIVLERELRAELVDSNTTQARRVQILQQLAALTKGPDAQGKQTAEDVEALRAKLETTLAGFTETLVDDTRLALDRLRQEFEKLPPAARDQLKVLFDDVEEGFREKILGIRNITPTLVDTRGTIPLKPVDYAAQGKYIDAENEKLQRQRELENQLAVAKRQQQLEQLRAIEQSVRGALQLADAFGIVDNNVRQALEGVLQIGLAVKDALDLGKLTSGGFLAIAGGAASFLGSLLGGESPEQQRSHEIVQKNTEALEALSRSIGDLGVLSGTSGKTVLGVQAAGRAALGDQRSSNSSLDFLLIARNLKSELAQVGLSMADLRDVAQGLGISFAGTTPTAKELQQVIAAIAAADITQFQNTFTGQLQALQDEIDLFDITDPIEQLEKLRALFKRFGDPSIAQQLGTFNLTTAEGRAAAEQFIQGLFQKLNTPGGLTTAQLGGLSPDEFRDFLKQFEGLIDQANGGPGSTTSNPGIDRSITEVTGSRLAGINELIAENTRRTADAIEQLLASLTAGGPVSPPAIPIPQPGTAAGGVTVILQIESLGGITITGVAGDPAALAQAVQQGFSRLTQDALTSIVDSGLGAAAKRKALATGQLPG